MLFMDINNLTHAVHAALSFYVYNTADKFDPNHHAVPQKKSHARPVMRFLVDPNLETDAKLYDALKAYIAKESIPSALKEHIEPILRRYVEDSEFKERSIRPPKTLSMEKTKGVVKQLGRFMVFTRKGKFRGLWEKTAGHTIGYISPKRIMTLDGKPEKYLNIWQIKQGQRQFYKRDGFRIEQEVSQEVLVGNTYRLLNGKNAAKYRKVNVPPTEKNVEPEPMIASKWIANYGHQYDETTTRLVQHLNTLRYAFALAMLRVVDTTEENVGYLSLNDTHEIHMIDFGLATPGQFERSAMCASLLQLLHGCHDDSVLKLRIQKILRLPELSVERIKTELKLISEVQETDIESMASKLGIEEMGVKIAADLTAVKNAIKKSPVIFSNDAKPVSPPKKRIKLGEPGATGFSLSFRF